MLIFCPSIPGTVSVSAYELNIENLSSTSRRTVTAAEAGYGDDPAYAGFTFSQVTNLPGTQKMKGVDVEYTFYGLGVLGFLVLWGLVTVVTNRARRTRMA